MSSREGEVLSTSSTQGGQQALGDSGVPYGSSESEQPQESSLTDISELGRLIDPWRPEVLSQAIDALLEMLAAVQRQIALVQDLAGPDQALLKTKFVTMIAKLVERIDILRGHRPTAIKHTLPDDSGRLCLVRPKRYGARSQPPEETEDQEDEDISTLGSSSTGPSARKAESKSGSQPTQKRGAKKKKSKGNRRRSTRGKPESAQCTYDRVLRKVSAEELKLDGFDGSVYEDHHDYRRFCEARKFDDDETARLLYYVLSGLSVQRLRRFFLTAQSKSPHRLTFAMERLKAMEIENAATLISYTPTNLIDPKTIALQISGKFGVVCLQLIRQWLLTIGVSLAGENYAEAEALAETP